MKANSNLNALLISLKTYGVLIFRKVNIFLETSNKDILIKILDDGNGFSKDVLDKLGEPYISKNKKGLGLGIFIAKNLIENMKGNIFFYNSENNCAVVEIKFEKTILL